jgi:glyoxylase I family protein
MAEAVPVLVTSAETAAPLAAVQLLGIHHVAVIASDYVRSKYFYTQVLGLPVVHETYRAERQSHKLDLQLPDSTQLELFSFPAPPPRPSYPEACGLRHLALRVADLDASVQALAAHGVAAEPVRTDPVTGARFTFLADPDGLPIELVESSR